MSAGAKIKAYTAALAAFLSMPSAAHADDAPFQKPTALELFQLRGMCQKLGENYEYGGKGATPEVKWMAGGMRNNGQDIHYNTKDGHCYLLARFSDDDTMGCANSMLYDVQTNDLVANSELTYGCKQSNRKGRKDLGQVWVGPNCTNYDCASDFITSKMTE